MNDFRTVVRTRPGKLRFGLQDVIFTTGSCFAEAIGTRLAQSRIKTLNNPFGSTYNPVSIHKNLTQALLQASPADDTYLLSQDIHLNYDFHSSLSAMDLQTLRNQLHHTITTSHEFLKQSTRLLITYGTAWVYRMKGTGEIVSNCHKVPADRFDKSLLTQKQVLDSFEAFYKTLMSTNPHIDIVLTVSPVRHIKDTLELNSVSKSVLRLTCHTLQEQYGNVHYFPAFEMMVDDLRDYRFYKGDMIHPTPEAEDYIWNQFVDGYGDDVFQGFYPKWKAVQAALNHKPFHPQSAGHQIFVRDTIRKLEELSTLVNVAQEVVWLKSQLLN